MCLAMYADPSEPIEHVSRIEDGYLECDFQDLLNQALNNVRFNDISSMEFLGDVAQLWELEGIRMEWNKELNDKLFAIIEN